LTLLLGEREVTNENIWAGFVGGKKEIGEDYLKKPSKVIWVFLTDVLRGKSPYQAGGGAGKNQGGM